MAPKEPLGTGLEWRSGKPRVSPPLIDLRGLSVLGTALRCYLPLVSIPVIGLVGGIGAGKSLVAEMLRGEGCLVADSDKMAREALRDPAVRQQLESWWGRRVVSPDGTLDRAQIARIVFADPRERGRLEGITHPWINERRRRLFEHPPLGTKALIVDAALLLESGAHSTCDAIVFVESPREVRLKRVLETRGWIEDDLNRREAAQWPLDRKRSLSHHVLGNEVDQIALLAQVRALLAQIITKCESQAG
ncbi:MAG: dephospho-CoA kinase [Phycisphaerales bacterium]|nr:dephospho-CoA kinase [Phycisphaerales bacterium]